MMFVEFYVVVLYFNAVLFEVFCRFIEFVSNNKSELLMNNLLVNESSLNRIMGKRISLSTTCVLYSLGKLLLYCLHLLACSLSLSRLGPLLSSALTPPLLSARNGSAQQHCQAAASVSTAAARRASQTADFSRTDAQLTLLA